jgi:hypothetical protein
MRWTGDILDGIKHLSMLIIRHTRWERKRWEGKEEVGEVKGRTELE